MATPKKRTGKASQATRRANWKGSIPATTICPNCKSVVLLHTVCPECGYYKKGFASIKKTGEEAKDKVEMKVEEKQKEVEEVKKTRKPRAKKATAEEEKEEKTQIEEESNKD